MRLTLPRSLRYFLSSRTASSVRPRRAPLLMTEFRQQIQYSLGSSYTIERELGGGGMSRVFVAHDASLGRDVVVKVLPPELVAGVNVERFRREIHARRAAPASAHRAGARVG